MSHTDMNKLDTLPYYSGPLGFELKGNETIFRLWAPTAKEVTLNLYKDGLFSTAYKEAYLDRYQDGHWEVRIGENLEGTYYDFIISTHDREEAFAISDRIAIMHDGRIEAFGTAEELYRKPSNLFTAFFTGEGTAIPASVLSEGASGTLFFRPENAQIADLDADSSSFPRHMIFRNAEIVSAEFTGDGYTLGLDWNGFQILARSIIRPRKKDVSVIILKEAVEILSS